MKFKIEQLYKFMDGLYTSKRKRKDSALISHGVKRAKATVARRKKKKAAHKKKMKLKRRNK